MNQLQKNVGVVITTLFLFSPLVLNAEDIVGIVPTGTPPPTETVTSIRPLLGQGGQNSPRPSPLRGTVGSSSGKDFGGEKMKSGLMMASDTRVLPEGVGKMIQKREEEGSHVGSSSEYTRERGRMMASSTEKNCVKEASTSDCARVHGDEREGVRSVMGEHRSDIFLHASNMILKRMYAATDRFKKLADRMNSRIEKMKAAGRDTFEAEAKLSGALIKIAAAEKAVGDAKIVVDSVAVSLREATTTLPSALDKKPAKDALENARQAILRAASALSDVIPSLKGERSDMNNLRASTTIGTSTKNISGMLRIIDKPMPTTTSEVSGNGTL